MEVELFASADSVIEATVDGPTVHYAIWLVPTATEPLSFELPGAAR